jgi:hypothetical protein
MAIVKAAMSHTGILILHHKMGLMIELYHFMMMKKVMYISARVDLDYLFINIDSFLRISK